MQHFELPAKTGCLCRYDHGASILRLKKVPEMETMWFPFVDFRCPSRLSRHDKQVQ
jgi:hypothetical protein